MTRGVRGATTVQTNNAEQILSATKKLVEEMMKQNDIEAEDISHMFISATNDLNAAFPAKSLRQLPGFTYVPVMCMTEIDVPNSLKRCIRVMMVVNTSVEQRQIRHVFQNEAIKLRPDLVQKEGDIR